MVANAKLSVYVLSVVINGLTATLSFNMWPRY